MITVMNHIWTKTYVAGMKDGLPIGLGYLAVSFAFGI